MDSKQFAIGILSVTAVILLAATVVVHSRPEPASAAGMTAMGGDYVLTVGALNASEELLYVVDSAAEKIVVYTFDAGRKSIVPADGVRFGDFREEAAQQDQGKQAPAKGPKPRRGRSRRNP